MWDLWGSNWDWDRLFYESFGFPCQCHLTPVPYSLLHHPRYGYLPVSGRSSTETQSHPVATIIIINTTATIIIINTTATIIIINTTATIIIINTTALHQMTVDERKPFLLQNFDA
jgi:hypothetical protein